LYLDPTASLNRAIKIAAAMAMPRATSLEEGRSLPFLSRVSFPFDLTKAGAILERISLFLA